jgi:precorrin-2 methylase
MVESEAEQIYERALHEDVAFLVVGDPLWYCTDHTLLFEYACSSSSSSSSSSGSSSSGSSSSSSSSSSGSSSSSSSGVTVLIVSHVFF